MGALAAAQTSSKAGSKNDRIRVVLWHGAGDSFCAGGDLEDFMKKLLGPGESPQDYLINAQINIDKPLVAAVQGAAIGGGTTMLTHCDFVYAGEGTKFQTLHESRTGAGIWDDLLSSGALRHPGRRVNSVGHAPYATRASELGLVTQVVSVQKFLATATETAQKLAEKPAGALQECKIDEAFFARADRAGDES